MVAAATFLNDNVLNISLEKEVNLDVYPRGRFLCLCLRASCFENFTLVVRIMNEIDHSLNVIFSDRIFLAGIQTRNAGDIGGGSGRDERKP